VNGSVVGRVTRVLNVLDEEDFDFIGNVNSMEVHKKGCKWIGKMSSKNKKGFRTLQHEHIEDFDNCAFHFVSVILRGKALQFGKDNEEP